MLVRLCAVNDIRMISHQLYFVGKQMSNTLELYSPSAGNGPEVDNKPDRCVIERISKANLSYNEFYWKYMAANQAVIITLIGNDWLCAEQWIQDGKINLEQISTVIGNEKVPVANCSKIYFNSHEKSEMDFTDYLQYWNTRQTCSDILYLKDWHLKALKPYYHFYKVPKYFASDWLNEYLIDKNLDDYRFVYIGPQGSWTPFHADVFSSYSWSTNITGLKKWLILLPDEELKLKDNLGNDPFSISEELLDQHNVRYTCILQEPNESIFVPSGWYHQVWNLTDTISINHNWFNGCNIQTIWMSLKRNFENVVKEISDCEDMENFQDHCQIMLKAVFGLNFVDFIDILEHIAYKRMSAQSAVLFETYKINAYHQSRDLESIERVIHEIIKYNDGCENVNLQIRCKKLIDKIDENKIK